jgi:hypothetical protein
MSRRPFVGRTFFEFESPEGALLLLEIFVLGVYD